MPWYRIYAMHGPGHQSDSEFFRWYDAPLTAGDKSDVFSDVFDHYDDAIGDVELVAKLPQHIHDEKVSAAEASIQYGYKILGVLAKTETKPVIAVRYEIIAATKQGEKPTTGHQARLLAEPTVIGHLKPTRDQAVNSLLNVIRAANQRVVKAKKGATRYSKRSDYAVICR